MKKVTVAGGGVLGTQIAYQSAMNGMDTVIWLRSPSSITRTEPKLEKVYEQIKADIEQARKDPLKVPAGLCQDGKFDADLALEKLNQARENIRLELDMEKAMRGADIVIESMSEDPQAKAEFYKKAAPFLDEKTILVTNSSTLLPSMFADVTGRPDRYMALHFANHIWRNNLAEVMAQEKTDPEVFDQVMDFAREINMEPVAVRKEKAGYLLNSMLVPFLFAAQDLYVTETANPEDIDKAWVKGTGAPYGPFQMLNAIGLETARNIALMYCQIPEEQAPFHYRKIVEMLDKMIQENRHFDVSI